MERLDKFLCDRGVGTRSQVKAILKAGRVTVDGKAEKELSFAVYATLVGWEHPLDRINRDTVSKLTDVEE